MYELYKDNQEAVDINFLRSFPFHTVRPWCDLMCIMQERYTWITQQLHSLKSNSQDISVLTCSRSKKLHHACRLSPNVQNHARLTFLLLPANAPGETSTIKDRDVRDNRPDVFVVCRWGMKSRVSIPSDVCHVRLWSLWADKWCLNEGLSVEGDRRGGHGHLVSSITGRCGSSNKESSTKENVAEVKPTH